MKNLRTKLVCLLVLAICVPCYAQRITTVVLDDWEAIAQNAAREGTTYDIKNFASTTVFVSLALNAGTAHTGTKVFIQTSPMDSGDETWITQASLTTMVGTGSSTVMGFPVNAASKTIAVDTLPGSFILEGLRTIFLLGSPTVADSELCTLISHVSSAASSVTILDALTNTAGGSSTFYNLTSIAVVEIPQPTNRIRVLYDNTYDANGATCWSYSALFGKRE